MRGFRTALRDVSGSRMRYFFFGVMDLKASRSSVRPLAEGALMVALSTILGYLYLYRLPQGGSFDLALVPMFLYCLRWGPKWSFGACFLHGLLQYFLGGGIAISWQSMLLDYVVAETLVGFCSFAAGKKGGWIWGVLLGTFGRFLSLLLSGGLLWYMYMPETFLGLPMVNPWVYSALYNGFLCTIVMLLDLIVLGLMRTNPKLRQQIFTCQA